MKELELLGTTCRPNAVKQSNTGRSSAAQSPTAMADFPHLAAGRPTDPEGTIGFALAGPRIAFERTLAAVGQHIQGNVRSELVRPAQLVELLSDQCPALLVLDLPPNGGLDLTA